MSSVTVSALGLVYPDGTAALDDINLTIGDGEFVALVGPSGSGKTTLLRTIAGFIRPTSGSVRIDDLVVADRSTLVPPEARRLGMVFQQHAVWPHWNVERNVGYPLKLSRVPRSRRAERVAAVLELVGLDGYGHRNPATLSGGQRQRVALARAIVARPRVLLLDEALSALDEPLRDRLRIELQTLVRSEGLTVLHVTHDRAEALALADRVVVLDRGRVAQIGTPPELVTAPGSPGVARFLSDATILDGVLEDGSFTASGHPCRVPAACLQTRSGRPDGRRGAVAILPEELRLDEPTGIGDAVVTSSLFGRDGNDVIVDWHGVAVRCRVPGRRPLVGEQVAPRVTRAMFYPDAAPVPETVP